MKYAYVIFQKRKGGDKFLNRNLDHYVSFKNANIYLTKKEAILDCTEKNDKIALVMIEFMGELIK